MAVIRFLGTVPTTQIGVSYIEAGPDKITVTANGVIDTYTGSFVYSGDTVVGGMVTGYTITYAGQVVFSAEGLTVSAPAMAQAVLSGDANTAARLIYSGNDQIFGRVQPEALIGLEGNDTIIALDGNDIVTGGFGDDDVNGNVGDDLVFGDAGADWVRGGKDNDTIYGGDGDDPHVNGNIGNDIAYGGSGGDSLFGGQDQDTLYGEAGNDLLSGDLGNDILNGGAGADRFVQRAGGGTDWVADWNFAAGDRIQLAPGTAYSVTAISNQVVIDLGGGAQLGLAGVAAGSFSADWIVFA